MKDNQILVAESLGNFYKMNPETIYKWANEHNIKLIINAYKWIKKIDYNFISCVINNKKI